MLNCMQRVTVTSVRFRLSTNSNLACQEKLARGFEIHRVSNSAVWPKHTQIPMVALAFPIQLQPSAIESDPKVYTSRACGCGVTSTTRNSKDKHCRFFFESKRIGLYFGLHSFARALQSATDHRSKVEFRRAAQGSRHTHTHFSTF